MKLFWWIASFFKDELYFWDYKSYRRCVGGRWGLWESNMFGDGVFKVWMRSDCKHYPAPPFVTSTEPLEIEDYVK